MVRALVTVLLRVGDWFFYVGSCRLRIVVQKVKRLCLESKAKQGMDVLCQVSII